MQYIRNVEYAKGKVGQGQWWTKAASLLMDKECHSSGVIADVGQIHPKANREGLARFVQKRRASELSAPGMARLLPQIPSTRNLRTACYGSKLYTLDCDA
jgi:hypothetical protein